MTEFPDIFCLCLPASGAGIGLHTLSCLGCRRCDSPGVPGVSRLIFHLVFVFAGCRVPVIGFIFAPFGGKGMLMCRIKFINFLSFDLRTNRTGIGFNALFGLCCFFCNLAFIPFVSGLVFYFVLVFTSRRVPVIGFIFAPFGSKSMFMCRIFIITFFIAGCKTRKYDCKQ